jgi:hypothetical protein
VQDAPGLRYGTYHRPCFGGECKIREGIDPFEGYMPDGWELLVTCRQAPAVAEPAAPVEAEQAKAEEDREELELKHMKERLNAL